MTHSNTVFSFQLQSHFQDFRSTHTVHASLKFLPISEGKKRGADDPPSDTKQKQEFAVVETIELLVLSCHHEVRRTWRKHVKKNTHAYTHV